MKRRLGEGREILILEPRELLRRLATLVPPPRAHLVRYHGIFGPASKWRREIVPAAPQSTCPQKALVRATHQTHPARRQRPSLAGSSIRAFRGTSCSCASSARTSSLVRAADAARSSPSSTRSR